MIVHLCIVSSLVVVVLVIVVLIAVDHVHVHQVLVHVHVHYVNEWGRFFMDFLWKRVKGEKI